MAEPDASVAPAMVPSPPESVWRAPAVGVASALVLFCAAVVFMMLVRYTQERTADPLNDKTLIGLRAKFMASPEDSALKQAIREKDLDVRQSFFAIQWHLNSGAWVLAPALAALLILLNFLVLSRAPAPDPESFAGRAGVWQVADQRRRAVAAFAVAVVVLAAVAAVVFAKGSILQNENAKSDGVQKVGR